MPQSSTVRSLAILSAVALPVPTLDAQDLYDDTVLRTFALTFHQSDWWDQLTYHKEQDTGIFIEADLVIDGILYPDVGVKFKGLDSYNNSGKKKPFRIKLDEFVPDQNVQGYDNLRLNNAYLDPTFVREPLMYRLLRDYCPGSKCNFIKLTINGENWGVYINDQMKDRRYMRDWYEANTGNRYKTKWPPEPLTWLGPTPPPYMPHWESQADDHPDPWTDLIHLCDILNHTPTGPALTGALNPIFDLDGTLWMFAVNNAFGNDDSCQGLGYNFYVFHDEHHGRMEAILHDLNYAFGTWGADIDYPPTDNFDNPQYPLVHRTFHDVQLQREYFHHLRLINEEIFRWDVIEPLALQYQALIDAEVKADKKKLYSYDDFITGVYQDKQYGGWSVRGLKPYTEGRHDFLAAHPLLTDPLVELDSLTHNPTLPTRHDPVTVTVRVGSSVPASRIELRWRVIGGFESVQMFDDGQSGDGAAGDGVYGATIPARPPGSEVQYFVVANSRDGLGTNFLPSRGERAAHSYFVQGNPHSDLKINELLARNDSNHQDENGDYDDWIEIVNVGAAAIDLSGMYLTDDLSVPTEWALPNGTVVAAGETLLVWADDEPEDGPYHATFKLGGDGDTVALFDSDGSTLVDVITFGQQAIDVSTRKALRRRSQHRDVAGADARPRQQARLRGAPLLGLPRRSQSGRDAIPWHRERR